MRPPDVDAVACADPVPRPATTAAAVRTAARLTAILLALGASGCATTGAIRGTVALPPTSAGRATIDEGAGGPPDLREAVTFVVDDREQRPGAPADTTPRHVRHTSAGFHPRVVVVRAGTTVAFENCDSLYHSVFSLAHARPFDTGLYAPGRERPVRFDRPGIVDLYCEIHPRYCGFVVVVPNRHYARPDSSGAFRLPPLKTGTYRVKAWHPLYGETGRSMHVSKDGAAVVRLAF